MDSESIISMSILCCYISAFLLLWLSFFFCFHHVAFIIISREDDRVWYQFSGYSWKAVWERANYSLRTNVPIFESYYHHVERNAIWSDSRTQTCWIIQREIIFSSSSVARAYIIVDRRGFKLWEVSNWTFLRILFNNSILQAFFHSTWPPWSATITHQPQWLPLRKHLQYHLQFPHPFHHRSLLCPGNLVLFQDQKSHARSVTILRSWSSLLITARLAYICGQP